MSESTSTIEKLRRELENSVDLNIDSINGLYELIDTLIEVVQNLQKDVQSLAAVFINNFESNSKSIDKINKIKSKEIYI